MSKFIIGTLLLLQCASISYAQDNDSVTTKLLDEVTVESQLQKLGAQVSTFIPTSRQKKSSQNATDLLSRMAIPQLRTANGVKTASGQDVDIFIDFLPADGNDLAGMRTTDVKFVEYYDFPSDPRFLGKAHVVNFIMQKYAYGGYVKGYAQENFIVNTGQMNLYGKLKYKRMTYDLALGAWYDNTDHEGESAIESFRLPQPDGSVKTFERFSESGASKLRKRTYWGTFKNVYATEKISVRNIISGDFDLTPEDNRSGYVKYVPDIFKNSDYISDFDSKINSVIYNGYMFLSLPRDNSLTFTPGYAFSHTSQNSSYSENEEAFVNRASDNTHQFNADISFTHNFGKAGKVSAMVRTVFSSSSTHYSGTSTSDDKSRYASVMPYVNYNISSSKFYSLVGAGLNFYKSKYQETDEKTLSPYVYLSLQYSPDNKNSLSGSLSFYRQSPSSAFRSENIVRQNPLMSITGNPSLKPYKTYSADIIYTFIPSNRFNISLYGNMNLINDRFVFDYKASPDGILRTIRQPADDYASYQYGIYWSAKFFNRSLQLSGYVTHQIYHNGNPYGWTKSNLDYYIDAMYYLGDFYFEAIYIPRATRPDSFYSGAFNKTNDAYFVQAGWANSSWNVRVLFRNFARWNWKSSEYSLDTPGYSVNRQNFSNMGGHSMLLVAATYTFGFGKKVNRGDEASQQSRASSAILK